MCEPALSFYPPPPPPPYLSFPVHTNNAIRWIMGSRDEDGVPTDTVHVNTGTTFNIIQMDVAILCDQENNTMLLTDL